VDLSIFEAKALANALTAHGHSVSERTVQRWKAGATKPKPQDIDAIHRLLGQQEESPPAWAEGLVDDAVTRIVTLLGGPEYPDAIERLRVRLANTPPLPHEVPPEGGGAQDPGTGERPERTVG
jgi:hypothetical protein